jgi:PAS domain S-box-containing protein
MRYLKTKATFQLFIIMMIVLFLMSIASITIIYNVVFNEKKILMHELGQNQKNLIISIYKETNDINKVLDILTDQKLLVNDLGETGEFTIGYLRNDSIYFIISLRNEALTNACPVSRFSDRAIPMQMALSEKTGYIKGLDYKGDQVFAYYTYIPELKWGIVTKMNISEVKLPFYKTGALVFIISILLFIISTLLFRRASGKLNKKIDESEENYRRLFEYSAIPIWRQDYSEVKKYLDDLKKHNITNLRAYFDIHKEDIRLLASKIKVLEINAKSVDFFGVESKEHVIKNTLFYFTEESLEVFKEALCVFFEGGKRFEGELPIKILSGESKTIYVYLSVVKGYEESMSNVLLSFIDITERKKYEEKLILSRKEWVETFDLIPDMITILDNDYRIVRANKASILNLNISPECSIDLRCYNCVHGKDKPPVNCPHQMMIVDGKEHTSEFYEEKLKMHLLVTVTPMFDNSGKLIGSVHIARDISEQKQIAHELEDKNAKLEGINATKDKFFKIIAHDMKNPFISLLGASELLYENAHKYDREKIERLTKLLNDSAKSGYDMLLNLLEWSRSQAGSLAYQPEKIKLLELIKSNIANLAENAKGKEIEMEIKIDEDLHVFADKNMLDAIMRNLVNNALKFTPKGGNVHIGAKKEPDSVIIFVKDSGIGINKNDFDKLFREDIKYSNPGTEHEGGTGLGLLLCKEFVEKQGGKLWFESEVGKGTTFFFTLIDKECKV